MTQIRLLLLTLLITLGLAFSDQSIADQYPGSILYSKPVELIPNVWTAIGATAPPTYENSGHNNNYTFVITAAGVVVVNSGSYLLAKALHDEIRQITNQPVVLVINENGQGHAMLGNGYWKEQGVAVLAHTDTIHEIEESGSASLAQLKRVTREKADGDIVVWLPEQRLVISGDMAFHERILPLFETTDTRLWLASWERFEELQALYVIPGHGHPTNMAQVRRYTRDYLKFLRHEVQALLDAGDDLQAAYLIDQSRYAHLDTFDELASRNAGRLFEQMEFE